jgi:ATP-dependent DNA helicase RecG
VSKDESSALEAPLIRELGDRTATALDKAFGMVTVGDLLHHYPRRYVIRGELSDIAELKEGEDATVLAQIDAVRLRRVSGRTILEVIVTDGSARLSLTFFNQAWREKELRIGRTGMFAGKVGVFNGKRQLSHPDYQLIPDGEDIDEAVAGFSGKFLPVYPSAAKVPSWMLAQCVSILLQGISHIPDHLDSETLASLDYPDLTTALREVHQPTSLDATVRARERLTFDEALLLQLILAQRRASYSALAAISRVPQNNGLLAAFDSMLPFTLTDGQREVGQEIDNDMKAAHPMHRLLQGEVGSGKTIVALRAMLMVVDSGGQSALLAPTEVLAQQHYKTIRTLLGPLAEAGMLGSSIVNHSQVDIEGTQVALLTGSMNAASRRDALAKIKSGEAGIVIGTHALLSQGVDFSDLGLVVVDEQHRFGVEQRDALRTKAQIPPHVLVMTATPIPRTVAMTIFGDLEISTLRQLPQGRSPITTHVIPIAEKPHYLDRAWERMREEVSKGYQGYVVVPRICGDDAELSGLTDRDREIARILDSASGVGTGSVKVPLTSVEELAPELALGALKGLKVAILHGRLSSEEKDDTMQAFASGKIDVLVATTVIEVGVDVPNASMMVIMDSDRFGVSQLHQLRGRVGRGKAPGLCLLVSAAPEDSTAMGRLRAVAGTLDGFELSRIDLDQRSEGDVLGKAQSGVRSHLRLLKVLRDEPLIEKARSVAIQLIERDPTLERSPELALAVTKLRELESSTYMDKG